MTALPQNARRSFRECVSRGGDAPPRRWYPAMVQDVVVNGETHAVEPGSTVADLLATLGLKPEHVAVECNREIVPRAQLTATLLHAGDRLEVVTFVGGG